MRNDVQAKKARRHAKRVQQENELIEKSKVDEKARKILENRKIKESLEVYLYELYDQQAKNVKKGKEVAKGDDFKSSAFFRKLQVKCEQK